MKVRAISTTEFVAEFESDEELLREHSANLSFGALFLPGAAMLPVESKVLVSLRSSSGNEITVKGAVVAALPNGLALSMDADPDQILRTLRAEPAPKASEPASPHDDGGEEAGEAADSPAKRQNTWDRMRSLSQMEKILLAVKADRSERALLLQDNDPRVLLSLLRNPRVTVDEVIRLAKSSFLTYQVADVIMKAGPWLGNLDVRVALIHNPKTPPAFALRILPSLPEGEIRTIARTGTSMQLKQAALRLLQGK